MVVLLTIEMVRATTMMSDLRWLGEITSLRDSQSGPECVISSTTVGSLISRYGGMSCGIPHHTWMCALC